MGLQHMAEALAASVPEHLGQPTMPPIAWAQNGEIVTVILADGRKVSASIQEINNLVFQQQSPKNVGIPPTVLLKTEKKPRRRVASVKK